MRTRAQITGLFDGLDLVDPGVTYLTEWHPDAGDEIGDPSWTSTFAGVGRKIGQSCGPPRIRPAGLLPCGGVRLH